MKIFWKIIFIVLLLSITLSDSKKLCSKKLNFCKNSICNCPEGYKANKNKTCCAPICEEKCIGGKCVGINKCKCLPGHTATKIPHVCEPFCSNCTNGYCYGYEQCAIRRKNDKFVDSSEMKSQCGFEGFPVTDLVSTGIETSTVTVASMEERGTTYIAGDNSNVFESSKEVIEMFKELKNIDEFEKIYLPETINFVSSSSGPSNGKKTTTKLTESTHHPNQLKENTTLTDDSVTSATSTPSAEIQTNDELVFDVKNDEVKPDNIGQSHSKENSILADESVLSKTVTPSAEIQTAHELVFDVRNEEEKLDNIGPSHSKEISTLTGNSVTSTTATPSAETQTNDVQIFDVNNKEEKLDNTFYNIANNFEEPFSTEVDISEISSTTAEKTEVLNSLSSQKSPLKASEDYQKHNNLNKLHSLVIPLGIGILIGTVVVGLLIVKSFKNQQSYIILRE